MKKSVNQLVNWFAPKHYDLTLEIDRAGRKFDGVVKIRGVRVGAEIRLHSKNLEISRASVDGAAAEVIFREDDEIALICHSEPTTKPVIPSAAEGSRNKCHSEFISESSLSKEKHSKLKIPESSSGQALKQVQDDTIIIELEFSGRIIDGSMHGLYPCYYELNGQKKELLATQFESHHAREVFPSVDEPAAKATFDLTLITEAGVTVLSNMPEQEQNNCHPELVSGSSLYKNQESRSTNNADSSPLAQNDGDKVGLHGLPRQASLPRNDGDNTRGDNKLKTVFQTTPKMSTYLLAFVIGDLQKKTATTKSGVAVNIYATPAQTAASLDFALETARRAIDFYDEYFDIKYPLPKSDHVALPDFSSGAMENWGLITYRVTALLADQNSSLASKQFIATVVAHELSHQWFGNLVTMKWWDDLWLNESFASLCEHIAVDALFPDWQIWLSFETSDVIAALRRDALPGVQSVRQNVESPNEISTLFDSAIVYAKGERLLKMCRALIGEENFRAGLKNYFQKFAYQNTAAGDLWQCLTEAVNDLERSRFGLSPGVSGRAKRDVRNHPAQQDSAVVILSNAKNPRDTTGDSSADARNDKSIDVADLMTPWLTRPHYPVVTANYDAATGCVTLTQKTFLTDPAAKTEITDETWPIPLFANVPEAPTIFGQKTTTFKVQDVTNFQLNVGNNAHFIASFSPDLRAALTTSLMDLPETDRLKNLNEIMLLVHAGQASTVDYLEILPQFQGETFWAVWSLLSLMIADLKKFVETDESAENSLKKLVGDLARPLFEQLGATPSSTDSLNLTKLRPIILGLMIYAEDHAAINACLAEFTAHRHELTDIAGDLRPTILTAAVKFGDDETFDYLLDLYQETQNADLREDICSGLTAARQPEQIERLIANLTMSDVVRPQDIFYWFAWLLMNRHARGLIWAWCRNNWPWIETTFGGDKSFDMFPQYLGGQLRTRAELTEFDEFFDAKRDPALQRAIAVGHNDISARVEWLERDRAAVLSKLNW